MRNKFDLQVYAGGYFIIVNDRTLAGEDCSSTILLSCAPNAQPAFIEIALADSLLTPYRILSDGTGAARTDIGPRRTPIANCIFAIAGLVFLNQFQILCPDWAFLISNQRTQLYFGMACLHFDAHNDKLSCRAAPIGPVRSYNVSTPILFAATRSTAAPCCAEQIRFPNRYRRFFDYCNSAAPWPARTVLLQFF